MPNAPESNRLQRYAMYAALPTLGAGTGLQAGDTVDFLHYGGPAIVIERDNILSGSVTGSTGYGEVYTAPFSVLNLNVNKNKGDDPKQLNGALIRSLESGNGKSSGIAIGNRGDQKGPWAAMLGFGDEIGGGSTSFGYQTAALAFRQNGTFKGDDVSTSIGDWLTSDDEEVRGFLGFAELGGEGRGWLDIGWDGNVLTIYDYAVNFAGGITAGQTEAASAVPGAGGLAALAMGAAGLRRRRKRTA
ncbi:MAG: hypothetical protein MK082_01685 [Phycisphaerales bacterium]|nr:hypothetical protein [Phycisphaerales bacterium]